MVFMDQVILSFQTSFMSVMVRKKWEIEKLKKYQKKRQEKEENKGKEKRIKETKFSQSEK